MQRTEHIIQSINVPVLPSIAQLVEDGKCCISAHPIIMFSKQCSLHLPTLEQPGTMGRMKLEPARFTLLPLTEQHLAG